MTQHRIPRSLVAAQAMLERYAEIADALVTIEAERSDALARVHAAADTAASDLITERDQIAAKLEPWWQAAGAALTGGKRKSQLIAGCEIGTVKARDTLAIAGEEQDVIELLGKLRWAKPYLREKVSIEKAAVLKAIDGPRGNDFAQLGISRKPGEDVFFVKRAEPEGLRK